MKLTIFDHAFLRGLRIVPEGLDAGELLALHRRHERRCEIKTAPLTIQEEPCSHEDAVQLARLSDALAEAHRRNNEEPCPAVGLVNGLMLAAIIDALVLLGLYGHRLALWIDTWRMPWN